MRTHMDVTVDTKQKDFKERHFAPIRRLIRLGSTAKRALSCRITCINILFHYMGTNIASML